MTALKMVEARSSLQREGVYRWFSVLSSAQRAEFLCGLLDLCVPIELRFLGSCLEDLARKDYHSLRDAEIKANNPADLANLTNITDEIVRSKLLISLALLSSDNREAAGVLFRTLTHIDTIINNYGLQLNDGQTGEQFLLLFTMASNHPAFSFHQKQVLRHELTQIQEILQLSGGEQQHATPLTQACTVPTCITAPSINSCHSSCACASTVPQREVAMTPADEGVTPDAVEVMPPATHTQPEQQVKGQSEKHNKVWVERVEVRELLQKPDKSTELLLQVVWSDSSRSCVSRSPQELKELLTQVSQLFPDDCFEKFLPTSSSHETQLELDNAIRWLSSLPPHVLKHEKLRQFFTSTTLTQLPQNTSLGCLLPFRGVSSIQPVVNVPHGPPLLQSALPPQPPPPLPPQAVTVTTMASSAGTALTESETGIPLSPRLPHASLVLAPQGQPKASGNVPTHPQMPPPPLAHQYSQTPLPSHLQTQSQHVQMQIQSQPLPQQQQQQSSPEQNCLLDWLRKLRLHKYYPVFKQLTMEEFLALTEEDLNKYDLTQGAKKKLKTQLELQKEKRYVISQFPVSCGGVARVTPSSHVSPLTHTHSSANTELHVEVETGSMPVPRDSSSSSGYSSAPSSPMTPQSRDGAFDRAKDLHRRGEAVLDPSEKDRTVLISPVMSGSRPTAQVLPVQNDPASSSLNLPPPMLHGRPLGSSRKPRPPPLCTDERRAAGLVGAARLENLFPSLSLEAGHPHGGSMLRSPPGLMVETSSALTATSNTLHHVSHPPLHLQLSPSLPMRGSGSGGHHYPFVLTSSSPASSSSSSSSLASSFSSKPSFPAAAAGGVPMVAVPGNTYCVNSVSALPPSSSPTPTDVACYGISSSSYSAPPSSSSSPSSSCVCVCSSCGCSGNCGSYAALPTSYAGYLPHPFSGTSVFTLGPLLHLSPLLTGGAAAPGPFSYPVVAPPLYNNSLSHEGQQQQQQQQQGLVHPPMQGFLGSGGNLYQPHGMMGNGGNMKKGNISCYNCGVSGHRAQDCKQPPMDSAQQGTFRLRYAPQPDSQDSGD